MTSLVETAARIRVSSDCVVRQIKGETVLLHLTRGTYYGLDATGTVLWHLLEDGTATRFDGLITTVAERYGRATDEIAPDILSFLEDLRAHDLITLETGSA